MVIVSFLGRHHVRFGAQVSPGTPIASIADGNDVIFYKESSATGAIDPEMAPISSVWTSDHRHVSSSSVVVQVDTFLLMASYPHP